jgi:uncharacterized protein
VLELRPNCECCNKDLPPEAADAVMCSFECPFCRDCAETTLGGRCPNAWSNHANYLVVIECDGGLHYPARPRRI